MEIVPYSEPLNIPLEDVSGMSGDPAPTYNYVNLSWPEPKGDQPPAVEFPIGMPMQMPIMMQQPQFPVYGGNQMNWGMAPENMMGMGPTPNNMYIPPNQMMMNNQMYLGDQMPQQPPQSMPPQQQPPPQHHPPPPVQDEPWMGPSGPPMQNDQHWGQQQQPPHNNGPSHFERNNGRGNHSRWDNSRGGNYDSYRGKMNRNNQRGNRGGPYNRRGGHPGNGRGGRLCKYYAKQGFCKTSNCAFLHSKG